MDKRLAMAPSGSCAFGDSSPTCSDASFTDFLGAEGLNIRQGVNMVAQSNKLYAMDSLFDVLKLGLPSLAKAENSEYVGVGRLAVLFMTFWLNGLNHSTTFRGISRRPIKNPYATSPNSSANSHLGKNGIPSVVWPHMSSFALHAVSLQTYLYSHSFIVYESSTLLPTWISWMFYCLLPSRHSN